MVDAGPESTYGEKIRVPPPPPTPPGVEISIVLNLGGIAIQDLPVSITVCSLTPSKLLLSVGKNLDHVFRE